MFSIFSLIKVLLLSIYVTSAEFNLNSLNTTNESLDNFNQTQITLNNIGDYYNKDVKEDDPITTINEMQQQQKQQELNENGKLLLLNRTAAANLNQTTKYLTTNQKSSINLENIEQRQQKPKKHHNQHNEHYDNRGNHLHDYKKRYEFNKDNNENNEDNFNLNNKLKTIIIIEEENDAKQNEQRNNDKEKEEEEKEMVDNLKEKYQTKYYAAAAAQPPYSFSNIWFGQLPQFHQDQQKQQQTTQQMQLFLQQPLQQQTSSSLAASLLPQEYHHLSDYRFLFNAEHHTEFYLHTLNQQDYVAVAATKQAPPPTTATDASTSMESFKQENNDNNNDNDEDVFDYFNHNNNYDDNDEHDSLIMMTSSASSSSSSMVNLTNPRVLNVVTDTIGAVFGVNTRPVTGINGIHIEEIELYNGLSLRQSRFNPFNPCRILIHGWLGGSKAGIYNTLVPEYFKLQQGSYNIITVDWGKGAIADYITASYRVKPVGMVVAKFIDFLHQESGIAFENIHVIGFSMGAHIAGISGKYVQTGRLPVIYGLDPALPLFRYENVNERLDIRDADYVEVIHTSVGSYGYDHPLGHVDFYVNFGYNQPGCFFNECSHFRAFQVYAQSLSNEMLEGVECSGDMWLDMIKHKRCMKMGSRILKMGVEGLRSDMRALRRGLYFVLTNAQPPYRVG